MEKLFEPTIESLRGGLANIDLLVGERVTRSKSFTESRGGSWRLDENLKICINNIKVYSENISKACIKMALLITKKPGLVVLQSLVTELNELCTGLLQAYFAFLNNSVSDCLFDYVSKSVRVLLCHVQKLAEDISVNDLEAVNMHSGMIIKISEDNQRLPLANRLAYRRYIMEKCAVLKDTVKEFEEYTTAFRAKQQKEEETDVSGDKVPETVFTGMEKLSVSDKKEEEADDDEEKDDDDWDDENEDKEYTPEEVAVVEQCTALMKSAYKASKLTLTAITVVSDAITASPTAPSPSDEQLASGHTGLEEQGIQWVAALARLSNTLQDQATDLGADLYPPFYEGVDDTIRPLATILLASVGMAVDLLQDKRFVGFQGEELVQSVGALAESLPLSIRFA